MKPQPLIAVKDVAASSRWYQKLLGCTSGHGVCGLSYLSLRSLVATLSFMAMGFLTVYVIKHLVA